MNNNQKVILAFSGGLDTSYCAVWLKKQGYRVITVHVATDDLTPAARAAIEKQARQLGAWRHYSVDGREKIYRTIIAYLIKSHGLYQGVYPQLCADRYAIVEECARIAGREKTNLIAHGCTAVGNDQVRFDVSIRALGDYEIIAPIRDLQSRIKNRLRSHEIDYLQQAGFQVPSRLKKYTVNQNLLGVTISGSEIDELKEPAESAYVLTRRTAGNRISYVQLGFNHGLPVTLNRRPRSGPEILKRLNTIIGAYGIGRFMYTGDCIIGIKGRIAFECPGLHALLTAHQALTEAVLSREQNRFLRIVAEQWSQLVFSGLYFDPLGRDLEKLLDHLQRHVTGQVTLKVEPGRLQVVSYYSPFLLRDQHLVYAQQASWSAQEATGFVQLFGLSTILANRRDRQL